MSGAAFANAGACGLRLAACGQTLLRRGGGAIAAVVFVLSGCHKASTNQAVKPECETRADCAGGIAGGLLCTEGKCAACTKSRDCRLTEACDPLQKRCVLKACFGDECKAHADCATGKFCVQGLCLDPGVPTQAGGQTCSVHVCGAARDCNPGQICNGRTFVCETDLGCSSGDPCPALQACNDLSGLCEPACTPANAVQVCGALTPCVGNRCVQCEVNGDCGPGLSCNAAAGRCEGPSACRSSRDCASPLACDRATGTCAPPKGPCASNEQCATDERCDSRLGLCVAGACSEDRFAPNGSMATAATLLPGSYPQLTLCGGEEDWYRVALQSGDTVQIVSDADPLGSFDLQLFDQAGALLEENPAAVLRVVGSTASYFLRARTNDASAFYGLRVQVAHGTACAHNPAEAHPTPQGALQLPLGTTWSWAICPGEATFFSIAAPAGKGADVTASVDPRDGPVVLRLYDSDGATLLAEDAHATGAPHVAAATSKGGLFYLRVSGSDELVANRYDLTARLTQP